MDCKITLIPGDGIGPEIVAEAVKVLNAVADKYGHKFDYTKILMGGCSIDECGVPLTDEAVAVAKSKDAVLLGSIGGNTSTSPWYKLPPNLRPEAGLLKIRKALNLFYNLRKALTPSVFSKIIYYLMKTKNFDLIKQVKNRRIKEKDFLNSLFDILAGVYNFDVSRFAGEVFIITKNASHWENDIDTPTDLKKISRHLNQF